MNSSSSEWGFVPDDTEAEGGPGVQDDNPPGVPAGSANPSGEAESVRGMEVSQSDDPDTGALEAPVAPSGADREDTSTA